MRVMMMAFVILCGTAVASCRPGEPPVVDTAKVRNIPLSLFTGMAAGETKKTHYAENNNPTTLEGPLEWPNPFTGQTMTAYKRERFSGRSYATVTQYYAVTEDGQGIGRRWDSRWPRFDPGQEVKFPLGNWHQGESRVFKDRSTVVVTIEKIDFTYQGEANALQYTWDFNDGRDRWRYVYVPGKGMVFSEQY